MVQLCPGEGVGESISPSPTSSRRLGRNCGLGAFTVLTAVLISWAWAAARKPSGRGVGRTAGTGPAALAGTGGTAGCGTAAWWGVAGVPGAEEAASPWIREKFSSDRSEEHTSE